MRKTRDVTIEDDRQLRADSRERGSDGKLVGAKPKDVGEPVGPVSRDLGKTFQIREMSASQAEKWAFRALLAASRSGASIPDGTVGMEGVAIMGIQAVMSMDFEAAEPLLDEMMQCVQIKPDPNNPSMVRPLIEDDIEEVRTRIRLRKEVLELHVGFSMTDALSRQTASE